MGRGSSRLGVLIVVGAVAACAPPAERPAPLPTPTIGSAAPSPSLSPPSPGPLVSEYSPAGATAFVQYYFDVYNYAYASGQVGILDAISSPACKTCQNMLRGIPTAGGPSAARTERLALSAAATPAFSTQPVLSYASFSVFVVQRGLDGTPSPQQSPIDQGRFVLTLVYENGRWLMKMIQTGST